MTLDMTDYPELDEKIKEIFRRRIDAVEGLLVDDRYAYNDIEHAWDGVITEIREAIQPLMIRERIDERWKMHDAKYTEPCAYCMGEASSLEHYTYTNPIEDLEAQLSANKGGSR